MHDARLIFLPSAGSGPPSGPGREPAAATSETLFATAILLVEDESMIAWMIEDMLTEAGFGAIALAATGEQAETLAAAGRPGLVISDINLGVGKDGIAAAANIRGASRLPVIFVTAYADETTRQRVADAVPGAQLLRKPIDGQALLRAVMRALGN